MIDIEKTNLQRAKARSGLHFHLENGYIITRRGTVRSSTREEREMWKKLCPWDLSDMPATIEELGHTLNGLKNSEIDIVISFKDWETIKQGGLLGYTLYTDKDTLYQGYRACNLSHRLMLSNWIPVGFYLQQKVRIPDLFLMEEPPLIVRTLVQEKMKPFFQGI